MKFELVGPVRGAAIFAVGRSIRELQRLHKVYGKGRWRKRKGFATVRFENGIGDLLDMSAKRLGEAIGAGALKEICHDRKN